jgi:hypothetical protein
MARNIHEFFNDMGNEKGPIDPVDLTILHTIHTSIIASSILWWEMWTSLTPCPSWKWI